MNPKHVTSATPHCPPLIIFSPYRFHLKKYYRIFAVSNNVLILHILYYNVMRKIKILLFALLLGGLATGLRAQQESKYFIHTVSKGETLYSISTMYHITTGDVVALNPGSDITLQVGASLKIPQVTSVQPVADNSNVLCYHTIKEGETLYRLTQIYNIPAKVICDANPGLSIQNFRPGQVVVIPKYQGATLPKQTTATVTTPPTGNDSNTATAGKSHTTQEKEKKDQNKDRSTTTTVTGSGDCKLQHTVVKGETLYSLSHQFGLTEAQLQAANPGLTAATLKKGMTLCIPYPSQEKNEEVAVTPPSDRQLFDENRPRVAPMGSLKAAVVLPFLLGGENPSVQEKMVEYYEGFLMAVDSLKRQGVSMDVYSYDAGPEGSSVASILGKPEMKDMNIIFGSFYPAQTDELARFARENNILLVVPFTNKDDAVFSNPKVFQVNTPQSYFYPEVYDHFLRTFSKSHVIFLGSEIEDSKAEFIKGLKSELDRAGVAYETLSVSLLDNENVTRFTTAMREGRHNIFIPLSGSQSLLNNLLPPLQVMARDTLTTAQYNFSLFGYPEWQLYAGDHLSEFYAIDTYFYSAFYTNNLLPEAVSFTNKFFKWYSRDMLNNYPRYGMLGFDTGYFFLTALQRYGKDPSSRIGDLNLRPIQTGFKFDRVNNWGGFINKKVFFVHFSRSYELNKIDFEQQ